MFPCSKCGACCRSLSRSPLYAELDRGDGVCRYLEGDLCSIYEDRPLLCRVDESYDVFFRHLMDRETYIRLNLEGCAELQKSLSDQSSSSPGDGAS